MKDASTIKHLFFAVCFDISEFLLRCEDVDTWRDMDAGVV